MDDPYDLGRFVQAQEGIYEQALAELRAGRKRSHWMWFIFPQFLGLGRSATSQHYAIRSRAEAAAYLEHPVLGPRLRECAQAVLGVQGKSAYEILGSPDDLKLHSSATLFAAVTSEPSPFHDLLNQYFDAKPDELTLELLQKADIDAGAAQ